MAKEKGGMGEKMSKVENDIMSMYGDSAKSVQDGLKSTTEALESNEVVKSARAGLSSAWDGVTKFTGGAVKTTTEVVGGALKTTTEVASGVTGKTVSTINNLTSSIGIPAIPGGEASTPLEEIHETNKKLLYDLIMSVWVNPAFETRFSKMCQTHHLHTDVLLCEQLVVTAFLLGLLSALFLLFPVVFCFAISIALAAYACYHNVDEHLGWRFPFLFFFASAVYLSVGIWAHKHFKNEEQAFVIAECMRLTQEYVKLYCGERAVGGQDGRVGIGYIVITHVVLTLRKVIEKHTKGWIQEEFDILAVLDGKKDK